MKKTLEAIAFDIDGTLYAEWQLNIRIIPYFLKNLPFFYQYNKVRHILHRTAPLPDFYEYQARLLAENLKISVVEAHEKINSIVYKGLRKYFTRIRPYPYLEETFRTFKENGLKIGILSDFPPDQKGDIWGLEKYCDVILGSEACGALKPSVYAFGLLARELGIKPENILYVGNNLHADIYGAQKAGMKTAYIASFWHRIFPPKTKSDILFKNYRQLQKIVLE